MDSSLLIAAVVAGLLAMLVLGPVTLRLARQGLVPDWVFGALAGAVIGYLVFVGTLRTDDDLVVPLFLSIPWGALAALGALAAMRASASR